MKLFSEKFFPWTISVLTCFIYLVIAMWFQNLIFDKKSFSDLLNISLVLSSISLGFLGTMIGTILSITSTRAMAYIYKENADTLLISYMKQSAFTNLLILGFSIILLLTNIDSIFIIGIWLFLFTSGLLCSYRIIHLLFKLLESVNSENKYKGNGVKKYQAKKEDLQPPQSKVYQED